MNLGNIDNISVNGNSIIHKSGGAAKIIFAVFMLSGFLLSSELKKIVFLLTIIILVSLLSEIPLKTAFGLLVYPLFFSSFFALLIISESSQAGLLIILKASGAAFSMIWLILTTPYVEIFSILSIIFPSLVVDILFFTYRSFFILLEKLENIMKSIKLKGGYHFFDIIKNLKNIAGIIGLLIIHSFEMSERMYKIYSLRGYDGKLPQGNIKIINSNFDYLIIAAGIAVFTGVIIPWNI
jgi:cobalt/nickel transport system permease protein